MKIDQQSNIFFFQSLPNFPLRGKSGDFVDCRLKKISTVNKLFLFLLQKIIEFKFVHEVFNIQYTVKLTKTNLQY